LRDICLWLLYLFLLSSSGDHVLLLWQASLPSANLFAMSMSSATIFGLICPISSTRSARRSLIVKSSIALSSKTSTAEFLCQIPKFWNVKINKNWNHVCLYWLKFHKELKLFDLFKIFIGKNISNFLLFLEELFWENKISNINLDLTKTYANSFAKEILTKGFISNKVCISKNMFKIKFKYYY
jgi:hypothetical protein